MSTNNIEIRDKTSFIIENLVWKKQNKGQVIVVMPKILATIIANHAIEGQWLSTFTNLWCSFFMKTKSLHITAGSTYKENLQILQTFSECWNLMAMTFKIVVQFRTNWLWLLTSKGIWIQKLSISWPQCLLVAPHLPAPYPIKIQWLRLEFWSPFIHSIRTTICQKSVLQFICKAWC